MDGPPRGDVPSGLLPATAPVIADPTLPSPSTPPSPSAPRRVRLRGVDAARALAFGGMLLAHYVAPLRSDDPGWLQAIDAAADGRAAPLFCVLAGLSAGLFIAGGGRDRELVGRGVVLIAVGLLIWPYVERVALILPHYGLLLAFVPLLRRLPTRVLPVAAAMAFAIPTLAAALMDDHRLRSARQPATWADLTDVTEIVRYVLWTGAYPVVGWVGFTLLGLWLARQSVRETATRVRLLVGGLALVLLQPLLAAVIDVGARPRGPAEGLRAFFDMTAHANRFGWYVVASGTATAVIAACLLVIDRPGGGHRWRGPALVALGQMALTAYLAHIVLGVEVVWPWRAREQPPLALQMAVALGVFVAFALAARWWRRYVGTGPAEAVVRAVVRPLR